MRVAGQRYRRGDEGQLTQVSSRPPVHPRLNSKIPFRPPGEKEKSKFSSTAASLTAGSGGGRRHATQQLLVEHQSINGIRNSLDSIEVFWRNRLLAVIAVDRLGLPYSSLTSQTVFDADRQRDR